MSIEAARAFLQKKTGNAFFEVDDVSTLSDAEFMLSFMETLLYEDDRTLSERTNLFTGEVRDLQRSPLSFIPLDSLNFTKQDLIILQAAYRKVYSEIVGA